MTKEQLIQLIHIAKSKLGLDDETYRALLLSQTKKDSCSKMLKHELEKVYDAMKEKGFTYTGAKKKYGKPKVKIADRRGDIKKIKAIWITMGQQGFIANASDKALDGYVERMTKKHTNGLGIKCAAWLDGELAYRVIESLKKWHLRVVIERFLTIDGMSYCDSTLYYKSTVVTGYVDIINFYEDVINQKRIIK